jgi:hypothetical protein
MMIARNDEGTPNRPAPGKLDRYHFRKGEQCMNQQEHHEMVLETTHASGAEEWYCPTCGRRFLMQWPPTYKKIVLESGDEEALHSGSKGGLSIGHEIAAREITAAAQEPNDDIIPAYSDSAEPDDAPLAEELRPWLNWLKGTSLGDRLDEAG